MELFSVHTKDYCRISYPAWDAETLATYRECHPDEELIVEPYGANSQWPACLRD